MGSQNPLLKQRLSSQVSTAALFAPAAWPKGINLTAVVRLPLVETADNELALCGTTWGLASFVNCRTCKRISELLLRNNKVETYTYEFWKVSNHFISYWWWNNLDLHNIYRNSKIPQFSPNCFLQRKNAWFANICIYANLSCFNRMFSLKTRN